jgi:hypothetical protein
MNYALQTMGSDAVDAQQLGRHWCDKFAGSLQRALAVRVQHADQFIDVHYADTASDPVGTVQRIYRQLGLALDDSTCAVMVQWVEANRRQDRDPHHYTLEQFGFTREGLERQFAEYCRTFLPLA